MLLYQQIDNFLVYHDSNALLKIRENESRALVTYRSSPTPTRGTPTLSLSSLGCY